MRTDVEVKFEIVATNWLQQERSKMPALPDGVYEFRIADASLTRSMAGNRMIKLMLVDEEGHTIYDYLSLMPQARWKLAAFLKNVQVNMRNNGFDTDELINQSVTIRVGHYDFNGRIFNDVIAYLKDLTPEQRTQFAELDPLEVLKLVYPGQDVETLMRALKKQ